MIIYLFFKQTKILFTHTLLIICTGICLQCDEYKETDEVNFSNIDKLRSSQKNKQNESKNQSKKSEILDDTEIIINGLISILKPTALEKVRYFFFIIKVFFIFLIHLN